MTYMLHFICPVCGHPSTAMRPEERERQHLCPKCGCWTRLKATTENTVEMKIHLLPLPVEMELKRRYGTNP